MQTFYFCVDQLDYVFVIWWETLILHHPFFRNHLSREPGIYPRKFRAWARGHPAWDDIIEIFRIYFNIETWEDGLLAYFSEFQSPTALSKYSM